VVIVNRATNTQTITVDVSGYLPIGAAFVDALNNNAPYSVDAQGRLIVPNVAPRAGALLVLNGTLAQPPDAPTNLAATAGSRQVVLTWTSSAGAATYDVARSPVSGGGYSVIGNTAGNVYTDTNVTNALSYYYVVYARASNGLRSGPSNEVRATPHDDITWANLQWPPSIVHVLSAITPTEWIYGQVYIPGVTNIPAQRRGCGAGRLRPGRLQPANNPAWSWVDIRSTPTRAAMMSQGRVLPEALGTYDYAARYSTTTASSGCMPISTVVRTVTTRRKPAT
jgi:hypothetical protein